MKQKIRLTEGDLHRIIRNCVNEALDELDARTYASYANGREAQAMGQRPLSRALQYVKPSILRKKAEKGRDAAVDAWNRDYAKHDFMDKDDNYHIKQVRLTPGDDGTLSKRESSEYNPNVNKTIHGKDHVNGNLLWTDAQWTSDGYQGWNPEGAEIARQMTNPNPQRDYVKGQGWK